MKQPAIRVQAMTGHSAEQPKATCAAREEFERLRDFLRPELRRCRARRHYPPSAEARPLHRRGRLRLTDPMCAEEAVLALESLLEEADLSCGQGDPEEDICDHVAKLELGARAIAALRAVLGMPNRPACSLDPDERAEEYDRLIYEEMVVRPARRRARNRRESNPGKTQDAEGGACGAATAIGAHADDAVNAVHADPVGEARGGAQENGHDQPVR